MLCRIASTTAETATVKEKPYEIRDTILKGFMIRVQPSGSKTYYYAYDAANGSKQRIRIGAHGSISARQARDVAERHSGNVALGENVQEKKKHLLQEAQQAKFSTLGGFIDSQYKPWAEAQHRDGIATTKRLQKNFAHLLHRPMTDINCWVVEKWRAERLKAGLKPATINRDVTFLRGCLSKTVQWNVIQIHPLAKLKQLKIDNKGKVRYLTLQEEQALREGLNKREARIRAERESANAWRAARNYALYPDLAHDAFVDYLKPLVLLAINTGMRRGELFHLCWENISLSKALLTIEGLHAKSGKTRHIPLNSEAQAVLRAWKGDRANPSGLVFPGQDGNPLDNVNKAWWNLLSHIGLKNFRWHDMRHHFASRLVMAGVDLNTVRELLGHSDYAMTLRYAHLAPEHKREAVERLVVNG